MRLRRAACAALRRSFGRGREVAAPLLARSMLPLSAPAAASAAASAAARSLAGLRTAFLARLRDLGRFAGLRNMHLLVLVVPLSGRGVGLALPLGAALGMTPPAPSSPRAPARLFAFAVAGRRGHQRRCGRRLLMVRPVHVHHHAAA